MEREKFDAWAFQIKPVETKLLYENFLLLSLELQDEKFAEDLKDITSEKLRCEISRKLAQSTLDEIVSACSDGQIANFIFARAFGVLFYLFTAKGENFLSYDNSLPEYVFEICAEIPMKWSGEGEYGFFVFDMIVMQKHIDEHSGCENTDPLMTE